MKTTTMMTMLILALFVGCEAPSTHEWRADEAVKDGYPTACQRDTNQDGWWTLTEGVDCNICKAVILKYRSKTDMYFHGSDLTPEDKEVLPIPTDEAKKQL
jgi:hypothetical protein